MKAQSAMEYLMTYGWAILIIAVVLGALFSLGVFHAGSFISRAPPGSCMVIRPNGYGTVSDISLRGICNNQFPEFIFESQGIGDYIVIAGSNTPQSLLNIQGNITLSAWVYINGAPYHDIIDKEGQYGMKIDYNNAPHPCYPSNYNGFCLEWDTLLDWIGPGYAIPGMSFDKWEFLAVSIAYNALTGMSTKYWFANGQEIGSNTVAGEMTYADSNLTIGAISPGYTGYGEAEWFNGSITNVQIYNTSLSAQQINYLYNEGIGGVPVALNNLVAWYTLNGNANDSSGNGNNGYVQNSMYVNTWNTNYNAP